MGPRSGTGTRAGRCPGGLQRSRLLVAAGAVLFLIAPSALPAQEPPPEIELRKSFRQRGTSPSPPSGAPREPAATPATRSTARVADAVAAALGEGSAASGTLHLPGVGADGVALDLARTPLVEFASGRRAILDPERSIPARTAAEIERLWPGFTVVRPPPGAPARALLDGIVDAAGYASVLRGSTLRFGRETRVAVRPDAVVLRTDDDLLNGETRALSLLGVGSAPLPPELRELAREHRIAIAEFDASGAPLGADRAAWRDPVGSLTTVEGRARALLFAEIGAALGLTVVPGAELPGSPGAPPARAAFAASRGADHAFVFGTDPGVEVLERVADLGALGIVAGRDGDFSGDIGRFLARFGVKAIGPRVELHPETPGAALPRFAIEVPGWLAEADGRRLLITGGQPPPLVRLYLQREGIDIIDYRLH